MEYRQAMYPEVARQIAAPAVDAQVETVATAPDEHEEEIPAGAIAAEYYHETADAPLPENPDESTDAPAAPATTTERVQQATEAKQDDLKSKLKTRSRRAQTATATEQPAAEPVAAPAPAAAPAEPAAPVTNPPSASAAGSGEEWFG
jgi:hypothetical protein